MEEKEFIYHLKNTLAQYQGKKKLNVSGGNQGIVSCPECNDGNHNIHCYIKYSIPPLRNCFRCNSSGIVDKEFLISLGIYDVDFFKILEEVNKENIKNYKKNKSISKANPILISSNNYKTPNTIYEDYRDKLIYLKSRINQNISLDIIQKYKVILSIYDFLDYNNIYNYSQKEEFMDILDKNYIGFLSIDNNFIILRKIDDNNNLMRFFDYNILGKEENKLKLYSISNEVDIFSSNITLHIGEGYFDIINVERLLKDKIEYNKNIFCSVGGKNFNNVINYFYSLGFLNMNINIYSDNDVSMEDYQKMFRSNKNLSMLKPKINIYYNGVKCEKDFGVKEIEFKKNVLIY